MPLQLRNGGRAVYKVLAARGSTGKLRDQHESGLPESGESAMKRRIAVLWVVVVAIMGAIPAAGAVPAGPRVFVDATLGLAVNGYSAIEPQMFGVTAYQGGSWFDPLQGGTTGTDLVRKWGIESVGFPGILGWVMPAGSKKLSADDQGVRKLFFDYQYTDRYVYGRILPAIRAAGAEPWIYLLGGPPGSMDEAGVPTDLDSWTDAAVEYTGLCLDADPKLTYMHLLNEPNAHWFRTKHSGTDYANVFLHVAGKIKAKYPQIRIGGPVLCWPPTWPAHQPGQEEWYTWKLYGRPLIDIAHDQLDFMDWHSYGIPARDLEGEMSIVTAYAQTRYGKWLRNAITETNPSSQVLNERPEHYRLRTYPMMIQLLTLLGHPDKIFCQQMHDLHAASYRITGDPPTPTQEMFGILKPLRGRRLFAKSSDADLIVEAATRDRTLAVAVLNPSGAPRRVSPMLKLPKSVKVEQISARVLDAGSLRDVTIGEDGMLEVPAQGLAVIEYVLSAAPEIPRTISEREFFSRDVMATVPETRSLSTIVTVPADALWQASRATLNFGIKGPSAGSVWHVNISGETVEVQSPGSYVRVPLRKVPRSGKIKLAFRCESPAPTQYHDILSFASLSLYRTDSSRGQ